MTPTLAIVPARVRSSGVPDKNWRRITTGPRSCTTLALETGFATCDRVALSVAMHRSALHFERHSPMRMAIERSIYLHRSGTLDTETTPMVDVIQDVIRRVPGPENELIVLLQPTSPLRTAATVKAAIAMMNSWDAITSVVSVTDSYPLAWSLKMEEGGRLSTPFAEYLDGMPPRRQDCKPTYKRDGTVYVFRRWRLAMGQLYGAMPYGFPTPPDESLSIDTPADFEEAERRLKAQGPTGAHG